MCCLWLCFSNSKVRTMPVEMEIVCDNCHKPFKTKVFTDKICPKCHSDIGIQWNVIKGKDMEGGRHHDG